MAGTKFSHLLFGATVLFLVLQPLAIKARPVKPTGKIDHDTIKIMMIPRCGISDDPPNSNGFAHTHPHANYKLHFVATYSFFNNSPKWNRYNLTYNFVSGVAPLFTVAQMSPPIARAFSKWAAVSLFRFRRVPQNTTADIRIGFYRGDHMVDCVPFTGSGPNAAHAFAPPDGRFHYDADRNWSIATPTPPNQVDLEAFAVHEIGHNLGLGHSQDSNAIMWPYIPNGRRNVSQDDINGLQALYGY